jgi:hypothetical protein
MGNRAVVTAEGSKSGVYLHWNGGPESIEAFLRAAKDLGIRDPADDPSYFYARFVQMCANYFCGTTSIGCGALSELDTDNGDNGVYVLGSGFKVIRREYTQQPDAADPKKTDAIYAEVMEANKPFFAKDAV